MSETARNIFQRIERTKELGSVVHTMKALAASTIGQYEESVRALEDYFHNIELGLSLCLRDKNSTLAQTFAVEDEDFAGAVVFGSDQGLVGQFNEVLSSFVISSIKKFPIPMKLWVVGERIYIRLIESGVAVEQLFRVPGSVNAVTSLVDELLIEINITPFYIFHNQPTVGASYQQVVQRMLPLDKKWVKKMTAHQWETNKIPEVLGSTELTFNALVREYLYVILFKSCMESMTAENASRLAAMQRAEKNINEMLEDLQLTYHQVRQNAIDEELFDIISGFEALK